MNNNYIIAIMGPSGAGKTTLANKLAEEYDFAIPRHCTTRNKRKDDKNNFYRYLSHEEYLDLYNKGEFIISSGDGPVIKKEAGNFYGVLKKDCIEAWNNSDVIIMFTSYKDLERLNCLRNCGFKIDIVNLTFTNIEEGVKSRIENNLERNHTKCDIESRVRCAEYDSEKYSEQLEKYVTTKIFTDILDIDKTYKKVCKDLQLVKKYSEV